MRTAQRHGNNYTNTEDQLLAKDKIAKRHGNNNTTALNLAPATQLG